MSEKTLVKYYDFIRMVAKDTGYTIPSINEAIKSMERCICQVLREATPDNTISLKFMPHAEITSRYVKPSHRLMPNGKEVSAGDKMQTSVRLTPFLRDLAIPPREEETEEAVEERPWYEEDM